MRISGIFRDSVKNIQKAISHDLNIVNVDQLRLFMKAGSGGSGIPRYNGIGGKGGSIFLVGRNGLSFADVPKTLDTGLSVRADCGKASLKTKLIGDNGRHFYLPVPVGVEAVDEERNVLIGRCAHPNQKILVAKGGIGGCPENGYKGEKGDRLTVTLHLKLRPNVGLLGFPNAGKSTLLKAFLPKKSVKIAPYPFTTLKPQLGFWSPERNSPAEPEFTLSIADLPGIIEGASRNRGKGYQFLKHLEHCDVLLVVIDVNGFQLTNSLEEPFRTALETVALLNKEIENYDRKMTRKPAVLVINKTDIAKDTEEVSRLQSVLSKPDWSTQLGEEMRPSNPIQFDYVIPASAKEGEIDEVKKALQRLHRDVRPFDVPNDLIPSKDEKFLL